METLNILGKKGQLRIMYYVCHTSIKFSFTKEKNTRLAFFSFLSVNIAFLKHNYSK